MKSVTSLPRFTPGERTPVPIGQEAVWAWELVWTQRLEKISFASAWDRTPFVQSVVRRYTDLGSMLMLSCKLFLDAVVSTGVTKQVLKTTASLDWRRWSRRCVLPPSSGKWKALHPTIKKLNEGGVLSKNKTSSLARLNHYCIRNAVPENRWKSANRSEQWTLWRINGEKGVKMRQGKSVRKRDNEWRWRTQ
jgi:hypothetical protein